VLKNSLNKLQGEIAALKNAKPQSEILAELREKENEEDDLKKKIIAKSESDDCIKELEESLEKCREKINELKKELELNLQGKTKEKIQESLKDVKQHINDHEEKLRKAGQSV
jgi:rubrerythrin